METADRTSGESVGQMHSEYLSDLIVIVMARDVTTEHLLSSLIEKYLKYRVVQKKMSPSGMVPLFENFRPRAARQLGQPMHSQFANFGKNKLNSLNLARFHLLNPVQVPPHFSFLSHFRV